MMDKPSLPKGTRDFLPDEMAKKNYIFDTIRSVFQKFGYSPIETPAMENLSTLLGKYGEEGDRLLYRIVNSGNFLDKVDGSLLCSEDYQKLLPQISDKGLRYDLTVPFARFVVQHRNELTFPFKRYQIQPVWRADRPQKGRYREFYQCDADVVGSFSLLNEVELVEMAGEIYGKLGLDVTIKVNNRKILTGISEMVGAKDKITDLTVAIDKLDKIGREKVNEELISKGFTVDAIEKLNPIFDLKGDNYYKLGVLKSVISCSEEGLKGVEEMETIFDYLKVCDCNVNVEFDLTLARGLNYYTGAIFEVKSNEAVMGSIGGGGRYDNLTGIFGMPGISGVGLSFGAERIYDIMMQLGKFPDTVGKPVKAFFVNFGGKEEIFSLKIQKMLRKSGIGCEMYSEADKLKRQFAYADNKNIPFVVIIGEDEVVRNEVTVKEMKSGEQFNISVNELIKYFLDK